MPDSSGAPGPIEAVHDRLRAVLATNRNLRRALADEHAGPGEIAAAWTTADETILQAVTGEITDLRDSGGRPRSRYQPSEARIDAAIDGLILTVNAVRSMREGWIEGPDSEWRPSRQARERLRLIAVGVLRGDAVWREKHPGEDWLA